MRHARRTRSLAALAALALLVPAVGASAADTEVSFDISSAAGPLSISLASADPVVLGPAGGGVLDAFTGGDMTGTLPETTVSDARSGLVRTWTVSVSGTDFEHAEYVEGAADETGDARLVVPASNAVVSVPLLEGGLLGVLDGGITVSGVFPVNLGSGGTLVSGGALITPGSYTYTPRIDVEVPADAPAGTYTGIVTQTVS